jgi:parvulin-like peptidyl-prolyl isomerase
MVRASHILLSTREQEGNPPKELPEDKKAAKHKLAEELLKRARGGEDFAKLAKQYSEDPGSKDKGGEYIFGRNQMVHEFESAAFALKTNEVSDIVTTQFGYHIIKLSEKIPPRKANLDDEVTFTPAGVLIKNGLSKAAIDTAGPFKKLSDILRENLRSQEIQKQLPAYVAQLKKEVGLEILDEQLKPKEMPDTPALPPGHPEIKPEGK